MTNRDKFLITPDGGRYDHKNDPNDLTGLVEADHDLKDQMLKQGFIAYWAIDGRYRLTDRGRHEMAKRREEIFRARLQGAVGKLLPEHEPRGGTND